MRPTCAFLLALIANSASAQSLAPAITMKLEVPSAGLPAMRELSLPMRVPGPAVSVAPAATVPVQFGRGFDSATGALLETKCVGVASLEPKAGPVPAPSANNVFHESLSQEQSRSDMKTGASASLLYESFSASIGGSAINGNFHNSYNRFVTAHREVVVEEYVSRGVGPNGDFSLTESASRLLDKGIGTFRAACGDHFISGYKLGGVFNVVAAVRSNLDSSYKANETSVGVGFAGIFGADFSQSTGYANMKAASQFDVRDASEGVIFPAVSLESLKAAYDSYEALVRAKPGLMTFVFTPYATLPGKGATVPNFTALVAAKMEELARKRDQARTYSNDLILASTAASLGVTNFVVAGDAEDARKVFDTYLAAIATAVDKCRASTTAGACVAAIDAVPGVPKSVVSRAP